MEASNPHLGNDPQAGPAAPIPAPIADFLSKHIRSLEQLEILIAMSGAPDRFWTAQDVYDVIQSNEVSITNRLEVFVAEGLILKEDAVPPRFRYAPSSPSLRDAVTETAAFYRLRPVRTIEAIFNPLRDSAQTFADAFKFKKD